MAIQASEVVNGFCCKFSSISELRRVIMTRR